MNTAQYLTPRINTHICPVNEYEYLITTNTHHTPHYSRTNTNFIILNGVIFYCQYVFLTEITKKERRLERRAAIKIRS